MEDLIQCHIGSGTSMALEIKAFTIFKGLQRAFVILTMREKCNIVYDINDTVITIELDNDKEGYRYDDKTIQ